MIFKNLNNIIVNHNYPVKDLLEQFNRTAVYTDGAFAIVVDDEGKCIGVISDGDIRRKLVNENTLNLIAGKVMNENFKYVIKNDDYHAILRKFDLRVKNLPVLNEDGVPIDLYIYSNFVASSRNEEKIIRARVPVRVSFSGGGTDMSSYINHSPASILSSTINKYCTASVIVRKDDKIVIRSKDLNLEYSAKNLNHVKYGDKLDLIKAAVKIMQPGFGLEVETYSEVEPGTGLGGSSALVVSVIGALNYFRNQQQLDIYQISDLAYQVERIDMDIKGGWQDQYSTAFGGFSWIEFGKDQVIVNPLLLRRETLLELEYNLMLFRIGMNRDSGKIQEEHIKEIKKNKNPDSFNKMLIIAKKMKETLLKGQVKKFADLLHESWLIKQSMNKNVSNSLVRECYELSRKIGALGGKLLGAGGSGYLLIYSSPLYQREIKLALEKKNVHQEPFKFSSSGLEVWSTKR